MPETTSEKGHQKVRTGRVVSNKMEKTIVVRVERNIQHPLLKKYVRRHKKFYAHDEAQTAKIGDVVSIVECKPLSKLKRWRLVEVVERAK